MANTPAQPPVTPTPHEQFDEHSGVYGFFRRNQKLLLYTAGMFTLLTFSITGPVMAWFGNMFGAERNMPSIEVAGRRVQLVQEDYTIGRELAANLGIAIPGSICPPVSPGEEGRADAGEVMAILRRAAIEEGLQFSYAEVDRAIEGLRELFKAPSAARLAQMVRLDPLARYRQLMGEAMRVGLYIRLQALAAGGGDAEVLAQVLKDREKVTFEVASFDEKPLEKQLEQSTTLTDDDLHKWFDAKNEREKQAMQAFDVPLLQLRFAGLLTGPGQFDPEQWKDEALKDFVVSEDQQRGVYELQKEARFKQEDGSFKPFEDEAVKADLTRLAQAEQVANWLLGKLRGKLDTELVPLNDAVAKARTELTEADKLMTELAGKLSAAETELAAKQRELEPKPDDETLRAAVEAAANAVTKAKDEHFAAEQVLPPKKEALKAAEAVVNDARTNFDFAAAMGALLEGKQGAVQKAMTAMKTAKQLEDLEADEFGLGNWAQAAADTRVRQKGDLCAGPCRTTKAVLLFQALAVDPQPLKPWETLKPLVQGAYFTEMAKKQGEEKKKLMDAAMLRLAKEKMPEKVAELEANRQKRIDDKLAEWEKKTTDAITDAEQQLNKPGIGKMTRTSWQRTLDQQKAELGRKDMRKQGFEAEVGRAIDAEIAEAAKLHYGEVLAAAAAEAGFAVTTVGPLPRDITRQPRFDKNYDLTTVYLFQTQSKLKQGEATGMLQDFANRRYHVAVCRKVEPLTVADVTRRDFESLRTGDGNDPFASNRAKAAYGQAFTLAALELRYNLKRPAGEQVQK
ncbi:MAG: hypothetical protein IT455_00975 [Planctomycetes bacterium]|nr:hypothetical protein [Planctomycetota bacterium]